jgi:hypothetical protein
VKPVNGAVKNVLKIEKNVKNALAEVMDLNINNLINYIYLIIVAIHLLQDV